MDRTRKRKLLALTAAGVLASRLGKGAAERRYWVRPFLQNRKERGDYYIAIPDMLREDPEYYFETFRMTPESFENLLSLVGPALVKQSKRESISPGERLHMTLAYLASGDQQKSIAKSYRVGRSTACQTIHETVIAIYDALQPAYLSVPNHNEWLQISNDFEKLWQFPHCVGAIDGKHFEIPAPPNSGTTYYNYKEYFSVVLLASCDAQYNFTTICIGSAGSESDAGIFGRSKFGKQISEKTLAIPKPSKVGSTPFVAPYVFVADEAFPLMENLMRPYSRCNLDSSSRIFNYRLSRARRIIENTFGILVARWRLLLGCIHQLPDYANDTIKACLALHNFSRKNKYSRSYYCPPGFVDTEDPTTGLVVPGSWRSLANNISSIPSQGSNNFTLQASQVRHQFNLYFNGVGAVPWQEERVLYS